MRILLLVPPNKKGMLPIIPIGLLYIAANLDKYKIEYDFFDLNFSNIDTLVVQLEQYKPDIIGITIRNIAETRAMNGLYQNIYEIVRVTQSFSKVILGGAGFSIFPKEIMQFTQADYGIVGPGETAIMYIINNLSNISKGSIISKYDESFITSDISKAMYKYWETYGKYYALRTNYIPIQTTRGCIHRCTYCTYPSISNYSVQRRPVNFVMKEIRNIMEFTKKSTFYFVDSVFNMDIVYTKKLLKEIVDSGLKIKWSGCMNPIKYDEEMIELIKKSGCINCEVGIDSFSDIQLNNMSKGFNSRHAKDLLNMLEKQGLAYSISLIMGGDGETVQTLLYTLREAESFKNAKINAFIGQRVYPNTQLEKKLNIPQEKLCISNNSSVYIEDSVRSLLKSIMEDAPSERWNFIGELS